MAEELFLKVYYSVFDDLDLKGNEALVYSYIRSYLGSGLYYSGGAERIAKRLNLTRQAVTKILKKLKGDFLIVEEEEGLRYTSKMERILLINKKRFEENNP